MNIRRRIRIYRNTFKVKGRQKIFCIGKNKTGTTSLKQEFKNLSFIVGMQKHAETLLDDFKMGEHEKLLKYCLTAQVFQDFPFSFPDFYKTLDHAFPASKFILTERDSPEQWYNSYVKFYSKLSGCPSGVLATTEDLKKCNYIYRGWIWEFHQLAFPVSEEDPFQRSILIDKYIEHSADIKDYFRQKSDRLLVLNLSEPNAYQEFIQFVGVDSPRSQFPWEKKNS